MLEYRERWDELASSDNPFATVVMAHLKTLETQPDVEQRKYWKLNLTKMLYERGLQRQEIVNLYRFIDWIMILPERQAEQFWQDLKSFEEERKVAYVTTGERIGFNRGIQEGRQEGELTIILRLLTRRIGTIAPQQDTQIRSLSLSQLEELGEALLDFTQPSNLDEWLHSQSVANSESHQ